MPSSSISFIVHLDSVASTKGDPAIPRIAVACSEMYSRNLYAMARLRSRRGGWEGEQWVD